jgi:hypothetical protein
MSIAADDLPLPRHDGLEKSYTAAAEMGKSPIFLSQVKSSHCEEH